MKDLDFTDDLVLLSSNRDVLQTMTDNSLWVKANLQIIAEKTKVISIGGSQVAILEKTKLDTASTL